MLEAYGAYGEKKLYGKTTVGVIRSTFVVDADGAISKALYERKGHRPCRPAARPKVPWQYF